MRHFIVCVLHHWRHPPWALRTRGQHWRARDFIVVRAVLGGSRGEEPLSEEVLLWHGMVKRVIQHPSLRHEGAPMQLNAIEAADWPPVIHGERQWLGVPHESCNHERDLLVHTPAVFTGLETNAYLPYCYLGARKTWILILHNTHDDISCI